MFLVILVTLANLATLAISERDKTHKCENHATNKTPRFVWVLANLVRGEETATSSIHFKQIVHSLNEKDGIILISKDALRSTQFWKMIDGGKNGLIERNGGIL